MHVQANACLAGCAPSPLQPEQGKGRARQKHKVARRARLKKACDRGGRKEAHQETTLAISPGQLRNLRVFVAQARLNQPLDYQAARHAPHDGLIPCCKCGGWIDLAVEEEARQARVFQEQGRTTGWCCVCVRCQLWDNSSR